MKRVALPLVVVAALIGIALAGLWLRPERAAQPVPCADPVAGCRFEHAGQPAELRFSKQPAPLDAFRIDVAAAGAARATAEFQMQGMEMGFNRYDLKPQSPGAFTADVTLPVCVSGRSDWTLFLTLDDRRYAVPFKGVR